MTEGSKEVEERLREIREREQKATKGPWEYDGCSVTNWHDDTFEMEWIPNGKGSDGFRAVNKNWKADADFIAHARTDIPWLLAQLTAILEDNQRLAKELERFTENSRIGTCVDCGASIWFREARIEDETGTYHPMCRVVKQLKAAELRLGKMREALTAIRDNGMDAAMCQVIARAALAE